ncbi:hypothetical protein JCM8547_009242 [Rhodosporidiobolus lusitaniae]
MEDTLSCTSIHPRLPSAILSSAHPLPLVPPPPPPHFPMLLSLPPELLEHIVRFALPDQATSKSYKTRQDFLCTLCLASPSLKEIAQPILHEAFRVRALDTGVSLTKPYDVEALKVRLRNVSFEQLVPPTAFHGCFALREGRMCFTGGVDLSWLEILPCLSRLLLSECKVTRAFRRLISLRELSLYHIDGFPPLDTLTPADLPSLRVLSLDDHFHLLRGELLGALTPALVSQVDILVLNASQVGFSRCKTAFQSGAAPVVLAEDTFDRDLWGTSDEHLGTTTSLSLYCSTMFVEDDDVVVLVLDTMVSTLLKRAEPVALKRLYLLSIDPWDLL